MSSRLRRATTPGWLWAPFVLALFLTIGPIAGLLLNVPWAQLPDLLAEPEVQRSLGLSLGTAVLSTGVCVLLGVPVAVLMTRLRGTAVDLARGALLIPLVLSPVVSGLVLLFFWGRLGLFGSVLDTVGIRVGFSPAAVVIVQVFVSLPFFIVSVMTALAGIDEQLELSAATCGAAPGQILRYITVPLATPGIVVGTLLAFARSLGEYGATITFAGSIDGQTRTLPLQISLALNSARPEQALGVCLMLVAIYLVVLVAVRFAGRLAALWR
ncbi:molybdenum ABC transporter permease [Tersicoccus phoenicis]|uniref:Molybdenum ABC transporter permease n=1 Tax=Tersicoccus phoenicis TaxID=554083 RepID=A0A1R1LB88_9MICC|nr:ABC transporter permease subunit [Tersicoccus phoenicis]OMH24786.1 molybdenum ABC transporter permease [Tersicoccus phoenicis]